MIDAKYWFDRDEAFDVRVTREEMDGEPRYRLKMYAHESQEHNHGVPRDTLELILTPRQMAKITDAGNGWAGEVDEDRVKEAQR